MGTEGTNGGHNDTGILAPLAATKQVLLYIAHDDSKHCNQTLNVVT